MFRTILKSLLLIVSPVLAAADPATPVWCCPDFCKTDDGNAVLLPRDDASGAFDLFLDDVRVPVMPGAFRGTTSDRPMQYCIGYDAFGDPQIKCLLIPSIA